MFPTLKELRTGGNCINFLEGYEKEIAEKLLEELQRIDKNAALPLLHLPTFFIEYFFDSEDEKLDICKVNRICNSISQSGWTIRVHKTPYQWNSTRYMAEIYSTRQLFPPLDKYHGWTVHREFHPPRKFLYGSN